MPGSHATRSVDTPCRSPEPPPSHCCGVEARDGRQACRRSDTCPANPSRSCNVTCLWSALLPRRAAHASYSIHSYPISRYIFHINISQARGWPVSCQAAFTKPDLGPWAAQGLQRIYPGPWDQDNNAHEARKIPVAMGIIVDWVGTDVCKQTNE